MLVLSRRNEEQIMIGSDIVVTVMSVKGNRVKIGIDAPDHIRVLRSEVQSYEQEFFQPLVETAAVV